MAVWILQHVETEGSGTLGEFLAVEGTEWRTVRLHCGDALPTNVGAGDAVIAMGGPMNVDEEDRYPFLAAEKAFLRRVIEADVPVLGVCLGAQLIARACGAAVTRSPVEEVGWGEVALTDAGRADALFEGISSPLPVFQWHGDMFDLPVGGTLLATGTACPHQAFRVRRAWGLQFHIEATRDMIADWFPDAPERAGYLQCFDRLEGELDAQARRIYTHFVGHVRQR
ncbi:MAG: type 1 glutamine amidotransferase [Phycisphaerae bacterium]|nr:type 1 glutamine amidotransferase [Phycisphaerae bacterium]